MKTTILRSVPTLALGLVILGLTWAGPTLATHPEPEPDFVSAFGGFGSGIGQMNQPYGIAFSPTTDRIYVVEAGNHRVEVFDSEGTQLTSWGGLGTNNGQFNFPTAIAIDANGDVYVGEDINHRVQKFDDSGGYILQWPSDVVWGLAAGQTGIFVAHIDKVQKYDFDGNFVLDWGTVGSGDGQFQNARIVGADRNGNVWVGDWNLDRIQRFDESGTFLGKWGSSGGGDGQFGTIAGISVGPSGDVFVSDQFRDDVQKFTASGTFLTRWTGVFGAGVFNDPWGVAVNANDAIYVAERFAHRVQKYGRVNVEDPPDHLGQWGGFGAGADQFSNPIGIDQDADGNLYVADSNNHVVKIFDPSGHPLFSIGGFGTGLGQFNAPNDVVVNASGQIYVADTNNNRIQRFDASGTFELAWGTSGGGNGQFVNPIGLGLDSAGNVYVCDSSNNRVQRFTPDGGYANEWGNTGSLPGEFNNPLGLEVDDADNVWVADFGNHRVQKFDTAGTFLLEFGGYGFGGGEMALPSDVAVSAAGDIYVSEQGTDRVQKFDASGTFLSRWRNFGNGQQLLDPDGLTVAPNGDLFVVDQSNHRVVRFGALGATITAIDDVPNDEGLAVRMTFTRSGRDIVGSATPVVQYEAYRRIDGPAALRLPDGTEIELSRPAVPVQGAPISRGLLRDEGWEFVGAAPANTQGEYSMIVPTLADSVTAGIQWSAFFVRAATSTPTTFFDSAPDSGYSVDNLPPPPPGPPFVIEIPGLGLQITWPESGAPDIAYYGVYRSDSPPAGRGGEVLIATPVVPYYLDTDVQPGDVWYYRIAAFDDAENFSPPSDPSDPILVQTDVEETAGLARLELLQNAPNPFERATTIAFSLDRRSEVSLRIYDARGALVRELVREPRDLGPHQVVWDGRDGQGGAVASGLYVYELRTDRERLVRKLVLKR